MQPKQSLEIGITLNGWVLALVGLVIFFTVFALTASGAFGQQPPTINDGETAPETPPAAGQPEPVQVPERPAGVDASWVYTLNGEWVDPATLGKPAVEGEPQAAISLAPAASGGGRLVYLTNTSYLTNVAKTACAPGYHMASFWELSDISNLTYDYTSPLAYTKADSSYGPPSGWYGWVRTGYDSSGSSTTGTGNCLNWTTADLANSGVAVRLSTAWETAPGDIGPWDATSFTCSFSGPVWCVAD